MDKNFRRFIPIAKVDDEKRMVYGFASTPDLDSDGEIVEVAALARALPEYMKFPTIREMHQAKAAGTTKETKIDESGLYIGAKVVADDAWKLVKEGVYKGFSIGGRIINKVANKIKDLSLIEISLVDVPANKAAVIEVWKSEKNLDLNKTATGVSMFAGLMNHLRDIISMQKYYKKKTKALERMLEEIKAMIAVEASEKEPEKKDGDMMMMLDHRINTIKNLQFDKNNQFAEIIRKGVLQTLMDKKTEIKKEEDKDKDKKPVAPEVPAAPAAPAQPAAPVKEEKKEEIPAAPETPSTDTPAASDKSENAETLKKLSDIDKKLEKMTPSTDVKSLDLAKTVSAIAGTIAKMASYLEKVEARIVKLENTPAAVKSKSAVVLKTLVETPEKKDPVNKITDAQKKELETKKARLTELNKIFDSVGANDFAKQGFSAEAMRLEKEIALIEG